MADNIIEAQISLINVHGRFRKDFGDIPALADSIKELGLLQPIGIDSGYRLVFGERRLRAFKHLGRDTIPVRFVNLESLMKGELAENEFRKDFTPSERVAIGEAIEQELEGRRGANQHTKKEDVENFPQAVSHRVRACEVQNPSENFPEGVSHRVRACNQRKTALVTITPNYRQ